MIMYWRWRYSRGGEEERDGESSDKGENKQDLETDTERKED